MSSWRGELLGFGIDGGKRTLEMGGCVCVGVELNGVDFHHFGIFYSMSEVDSGLVPMAKWTSTLFDYSLSYLVVKCCFGITQLNFPSGLKI